MGYIEQVSKIPGGVGSVDCHGERSLDLADSAEIRSTSGVVWTWHAIKASDQSKSTGCGDLGVLAIFNIQVYARTRSVHESVLVHQRSVNFDFSQDTRVTVFLNNTQLTVK